MEERKIPPVQRGSIDGISPRKPNLSVQDIENPQLTSEQGQNLSNQKSPQQAQQTVNKTVSKKPKKNKNLGVIILAAIVLIGLSTFAIYTQLSGKSVDEAENAARSGRGNAASSNELIDQTLSEIDRLSGQPDTSGEGLSDEQLGL